MSDDEMTYDETAADNESTHPLQVLSHEAFSLAQAVFDGRFEQRLEERNPAALRFAEVLRVCDNVDNAHALINRLNGLEAQLRKIAPGELAAVPEVADAVQNLLAELGQWDGNDSLVTLTSQALEEVRREFKSERGGGRVYAARIQAHVSAIKELLEEFEPEPQEEPQVEEEVA